MPHRIALIQGHPDPAGGHYGHALAAAYVAGAAIAGYEVRHIDVARLDFPLLRTLQEFEGQDPPPAIRDAQETIRWAEHIVIFYPLWFGDVPAVLKGFFEQLLRPDFAHRAGRGAMPNVLPKRRSARIVITMGMPALVCCWFFGPRSSRSLDRNILGFCGVRSIRHTLIGMLDVGDGDERAKWLERMYELGRQGR